jgi:uncharacterized protein YecE (DUF72 family)
MASIRIGTSGWHYQHWSDILYPPGLAARGYLDCYARHFETVEINATHYRLPETATLEHWREETGPDFVFACKASRYITHMKKLKEPEKTTGKFFEAVGHLEPKLGPVLFQLPPRWHADGERLGGFLDSLPPGLRFAFEFREPSWHCDPVFEILRAHNAALCIHDHPDCGSPVLVTADFAYIRFHGTSAGYRGCYSDSQLAGWARRIVGWRAQGKDVFCYFNNDAEGHAVRNARRLRELAGS